MAFLFCRSWSCLLKFVCPHKIRRYRHIFYFNLWWSQLEATPKATTYLSVDQEEIQSEWKEGALFNTMKIGTGDLALHNYRGIIYLSILTELCWSIRPSGPSPYAWLTTRMPIDYSVRFSSRRFFWQRLRAKNMPGFSVIFHNFFKRNRR